MGANKHSEKWTLEDEEAWLDSVISSHGKINRTCKGASVLKTKVISALDELKPVVLG